MSLTLTNRELSDLECLLNGSYAPLTGFMSKAEYDGVVNTCHLPNGSLWALPVVLHINEQQKSQLENVSEVCLRDETSLPIATLHVSEIFKPDFEAECTNVYGTLDTNHPSVNRVLKQTGYYISGRVSQLNPVQHYDFVKYRLTPSQVKAEFEKLGWTKIVAFQTRNPLHRSHVELTKLGVEMAGEDAKLLLHPVVGDTQECDVDYFTRCLCYQKLLKYYGENNVMLSLLPYSMRMGGPREALQHAIIRRNYGCTHFIVGRDHAGPSYKRKDGGNFYGTYEAQQFALKYEQELGMKILCLPNIQYVEGSGYLREDRIPTELQANIKNISGTAMRNMLENHLPIPEWYTYPDIAEELQRAYDQSKGVCIYLIGLSGSGKSTLANALKSHLLETQRKPVTILDGDVVRNNLSKGLGFTRADRSTNVRRIGYVASEIVKHGGIVICANIAPYEDDRQFNRSLIQTYGKYIEVYMNTPLAVCEERDIKGLYKLAREGKVKEFTGISDPFEEPLTSDLSITGGTINENLLMIADKYFSQ
jgi:sulfate adenylyltransferase